MKNHVINLHKQHEKITHSILILSSKMTYFYLLYKLMT